MTAEANCDGPYVGEKATPYRGDGALMDGISEDPFGGPLGLDTLTYEKAMA